MPLLPIWELTAFTNQTARFGNTQRAFIFAGESYIDILTELEQTSKMDTKLIFYSDAYRCLTASGSPAFL